MLPGFRFLLAAITLSVSVVIFGLGAAALLRASHEQFAALPAWRAPPEILFLQQAEPAAPTLAMLKVDSRTPKPATERASIEPAPGASPSASPPTAETAAPASEAEPAVDTPPAIALPAPSAGAATTTEAGASPVPSSDQAMDDRPETAAVEAEPALQAASAATSAAAPADATPAPVAAMATPSGPAATPASQTAPEAAPVEPSMTGPVPDAEATSETATAETSSAPADPGIVAAKTTAARATEQPTIDTAAQDSDPAPQGSTRPADTAAATPAASPAPAISPMTALATATDAPIQAALLDQQAAETAAAISAPVNIDGPVPLPRSRKTIRTRPRSHRHALMKRRKIAARMVQAHTAPAARAPIPPPAKHPPYLFGE